jgi:predicted outer membrane repeat protein
MNGGILRNSKNTYSSFVGGGVFVESGTFTMNNGTIIGNTAGGDGGGVYVKGGTFTMHNGTISGNTATSSGGGVYVGSGTFTMQGGTISGNTATYYGGGVYVVYSGTFTKSGTGGVIYGSNAPEGQANKAREAAAVRTSNGRRETTARLSTALDSRKSGAAGGWE